MLAIISALCLVVFPSAMMAPAAHAEDPGFIDVTKTVEGWEEGHEVSPGEAFQYTLTATCTNTGIGGCTNAVLTDTLPPWISLNGDIAVTGAPSTVAIDGSDITVTFTAPLVDPVGGVGLPDATTVTILIPVIVDSDIPADESGNPLVNTTSVTGDNTNTDDDSFTVVPNVDVVLAATAAKSYSPTSAIPDPGTQTTLTLEGANASNVSADTLQFQDPADPAASPNPFDYLGLTGEISVIPPEGSDSFVVSVWVDGAWINAPPGSTDPPDETDPAAVRGVRVTFTSTDGSIAPGSGASVVIGLEHRDNVGEVSDGYVVDNDLTVVASSGGESSEPAEAAAQYTFDDAQIPLATSKIFNPDTIVAGGQSRATLTATNTSDLTLDTLSITEPGADPNPFENGLAFDSFTDGVQWPNGATGATITYQLADGPEVELTADAANTLPAPPEGAEVLGFTVTFTGAIVPGAEAVVPFTITADAEQGADEVDHLNQIVANSTAPGGYVGQAEAEDTLTTLIERLSVVVDKSITPSQILSVPGEVAVVQLRAELEDFPASTTDAHTLIVQDPADPLTDGWWDAFEATQIIATPIPAGATLTVEWFDGTDWLVIDPLADLPGPDIVTAGLPAEVIANAQGLRFVYESETGFAPGAVVNPNIAFELRPEYAGSDEIIENCAGASASDDMIEDQAVQTDCPVIELIPTDPGPGADLLEKQWDIPAVGERTGSPAGLTLSWSTGGRSNLDPVIISDVPDPSAATLQGSVYNSFDLFRVQAIASDPLLTYDQVEAVEYFSRATGAWAKLPNDPCPTACDGTFPGVTVPDLLRPDVIGIRLVFTESPTRAQRHGDNPLAPPVGSGVARSFENNRQIPLTFQLRDELRSDATVPVLAATVYNVPGGPGEVNNVARADGYTDGQIVVTDTESDIILITPVAVQVDAIKTWTGGPLGAPPPGSDAGNYPSGTVTIVAHNQTPRQIDRLTLTDPTGDTNPFDTFDLTGFNTITAPASIGADGVVITLTLADGGQRVLTRAQALAADEAALADVVGLEVVYTGRIVSNARAVIEFDTRLRAEHRGDGSEIIPPAPPEVLTVDNDLEVLGEDLVDYPRTDPVTHDDEDDASIDITAPGIDLQVTKTFSPDSQVEPDSSPVTVRLTAQPQGPSRANLLVVEDVDASFWNQYDFVGLASPFRLITPINEIRVDLFTGGEYVVTPEGDIVLEGGDWVLGETGATATLPDVPAGEVQGIRFTLTRDGDAIWENPANPTQPLPFLVERRADLRTGGPVPSTLEGNEPAPGETVAGEATNTIDGLVQGRDQVDGEPISAVDDAEDVITYRHLPNTVSVTKSPTGGYPTGQDIPYVLTYTNTGLGPIVNPVITDRLPSDDAGPLLVFNPDLPEAQSPYSFGLVGAPPAEPNGPAMPVDEEDIQITVSAEGDLITFEFPDGTVLEPGQTYTIGVALQFRPGLPGQTPVTNVTGIVADRPWDSCSVTLDEETGECTDDTTVTPLSSGALRGVKSVRAIDPELGVHATADGVICEPDADGFYVGRCTPITKPGAENEWRLKFTNTGNQPIGRLVAIDRLPRPGDNAAIVPVPRLSEWTPQLQDVQLEGTTSGQITSYQVFYTSDPDLCLDDLGMGAGCAAGDWLPWDDTADPADVEALKFEVDFAPEARFQPLGVLTIDLITTAPHQAPELDELPVAWNTVAAAARSHDGGATQVIRRTEGNKVGATLATGPLQVQKLVEGEAIGFAPDSFALQVTCVSAGEVVTGIPVLTLTPPDTAGIDHLPWGSECTVADDSASSGASEFDATTVTIAFEPDTVPVVIATNTYHFASVSLAKAVDSAATDAAGEPITYGPFEFEVACTFLGEEVYPEGYGLDNPVVIDLLDEESVTLTGLPAGAACTATETDTDGAADVSSEGETADGPVEGDTAIDLTLTADGEESATTNLVTFTNHFDTGGLHLLKVVDGAGADFGTGPFDIAVSCTLDGDTVWDDTVQLGGDQPLEATLDNIAAGATCTVEETDDGGATSVVVTPSEVVVGADQTAEVTVTNTFDVGGVSVVKIVDGAGADLFGSGPFTVELACTFQGAPVDLGDDAVRILSPEDGLTGSWTGLPVGAECGLSETDDGGATTTEIVPDSVVVDGADVLGFEVTNTFDLGDVSVEKIIDGAGADLFGTGPFTVELACTFQGAPVDLGDDAVRVLSAEDGLTGSWTGLPVGAECDLTETDDGGATLAVVTPSVLVIGDDEAAGFEVTNNFELGQVAVAKTVDGEGAAYGIGPFTVELACTFQGQPIDLGDDAVRILSPEDGMTGAWDGLPVGADCGLTETDDGGATATQIVPDSVTVSTEEMVKFDVTNTFDLGTLSAEKIVDGEGAAYGTGPFTVELACTFQGAPIDVADAAMVLSAENGLAGTWTGLPIGAECGVTETDDGGATSTEVTPVALTVGAGETAGFTVTNTFELGELAVTKVVDGPGAAWATGPFSVELACAFQGASVDLGDDAVRILSPEDGLSGSWTGLPVGAECGLTETDDGGATSTAIVPAAVVVDVEEIAAFTVTNTFEVGQIDVTKLVEGSGAAAATGPFTVELACTFQGAPIDLGDDADRILSVAGGLTGSWTGLPIGAECDLTETDDGGANSSEVVPASVVVGVDETAAFTVTNTFDADEPGPTDPPTGPRVETGGQLLERDSALLVGASIALLLMLGGAVTLIRLRGRDSA